MKIGKKGFTLVELLAALVILGMLTAIAAPNILGILQSSKQNTYIEDAKKLATLAEYKFRSDTSITKPNNNYCITMSMEYLGASEFRNAPYDGEYQTDYSYVAIKRDGSQYKYYVQLIEADEETDASGNKTATDYKGIELVSVETLSSDQKTSTIRHGLTGLTKYDSNRNSICGGNISAKYN